MDRDWAVGAGYLREWGVKVFVLRGGGVGAGVVPWVRITVYAES